MTSLTITSGDFEHDIVVPASKSAMQRYLLMSALADGPVLLRHGAISLDIEMMKQALISLGTDIVGRVSTLIIPSHKRLKRASVHCGESGLCMRMLSTAGLALTDDLTLIPSGTLVQRPIHFITEALSSLNLRYEVIDNGEALHIKGPLQPGHYLLNGSHTSQTISGLIIGLATCMGDSCVEVSPVTSTPYVDLTLQLMSSMQVPIHHEDGVFEIQGGRKFAGGIYDVEGDWSGAANHIVSAALNGEVTLHGLSMESHQADRVIIEIVKTAGARVTSYNHSLKIIHQSLNAIEWDLTHSPDLFPPVTVLALGIVGKSRLSGVHRLIHKESNRLIALQSLVKNVGGVAYVEDDTLVIDGIGSIRGGYVDSYSDHRIAMAAAVATAISEESITIGNPICVNKSYPGFFDTYKNRIKNYIY